MTFPDGIGFYPDFQNGIRGYNTNAARGADTFVPFNTFRLKYQEIASLSAGKSVNIQLDFSPKMILLFAEKSIVGEDDSNQIQVGALQVYVNADGVKYENFTWGKSHSSNSSMVYITSFDMGDNYANLTLKNRTADSRIYNFFAFN